MRGTVLERFEARVARDPDNGCWQWCGARSTGGYGQLRIDGTPGSLVYTHRLAYEMFVGEIPEGLELDHLCRNRACCNPEHLEPVTSAENSARGYWAQKQECARGHAYDEGNTGVRANGWRYCRACSRERMRKYKAAKHA